MVRNVSYYRKQFSARSEGKRTVWEVLFIAISFVYNKIFGSKIVAAENLVVDHVNAGEDVFIVVNKDYVSSGINYAHNSNLNIFVP